jgi:hypothetical protein
VGREFDFRRSQETGLSKTVLPQARWLLADAELGDHTLIELEIILLEAFEQATPLADQHDKSAA